MLRALALVSALQVEDPAAQLRRLEARLEELQRENLELRRENLELEKRLTHLAEQMMAVAPAAASDPVRSSAPKPAVLVPGPKATLKAKVRHVNTEFNFVLLNAGEPQGVEPGFRFDVHRDGRKVAVLEAQMFADEERKMTKARVIEGEVKELIIGDEAVARRVGTPNVEPPEDFRRALDAVERSKARVGDRVKDDSFMVTVGQEDGLTVGDVVYAYRGGKLRGTLKLDFVDKAWSLGKPEGATPIDAISKGDLVALKKLGPALAGRIRSEPAKQGIYLNLGSDDGARAGQLFRISRLGREIGRIRLTIVHEHWSIAQPEEGFTTELFQRDDFAELVP
jgi:hypothetical protein